MNIESIKITNRFTSFFFVLLFPILATAQQTDTLSIYFQFGEHKIPDKGLRRINAIPRVIYTNDLDSVYFIGMADSVGSLKDNLKLGKKRAVEVSKKVKPFLQTAPPYRVMSKGELNGDANESRRVDVIFFSRGLKDTAVPKVDERIKPVDTFCMKRADTLLHRCHIYKEERSRRRGHTGYVVIETNYIHMARDSAFYCAKRSKTKSGRDTVEIYPLKWYAGRTYGVGMKKRDMYTRIDKKDFDEFEVFTIDTDDTGDCDDCGYLLANYTTDYKSYLEKCRLADRFLMNHLEVKRKRFKSGQATVRIPRTYVDKTEKYYIGYTNRTPIKWRESSGEKGLRKFFSKLFRGKNGEKYYYADLPVTNLQCLQNIYRDFECCPEFPDDPGENEAICYPWYIRCGTYYIGGGLHPYFGVSYTRIDGENLIVPHLGFERLHYSGFRYGVQFGATQNLKPIAQASIGLDFITIPKFRGGASQWKPTGEMPRVKGFYAFYLGSSLSTFENKEDVQYLNHFSYVGLTYYNLKTHGFFKPYIQLGVRNDYLNPSHSFTPQIEFGLRWGWR